MARVTGPLLSMDASGAVGGSIVFSKWKGRNYVRRFVVPHNPRSALQVAQRAVLRFLSTDWAGIPVLDQATWDSLAAATNISPFNAYLSNGLNRNSQLKGPARVYPADESGPIPTAPTLAVTGGVHNAGIVITQGVIPGGTAWFLYRKEGGPPAGLVSELIAVVGYSGVTTPYSDSPLVPGTYHYKAKGLTETGAMGLLSADASDVVT